MKTVFGSFYETLDISKGKKVLIYPVMTFFRRLFAVYIVTFGTKKFYYQIVMMITITLLQAITNLGIET